MLLTRQNLDKFVCRHFRCENSVDVNLICLHFLSQSVTMYVDVFQFNVEFENIFFQNAKRLTIVTSNVKRFH